MNKELKKLLDRLRRQDEYFCFMSYPLKDKTKPELKEKIRKGKENG